MKSVGACVLAPDVGDVSAVATDAEFVETEGIGRPVAFMEF
jgi:hypothetical protein